MTKPLKLIFNGMLSVMVTLLLSLGAAATFAADADVMIGEKLQGKLMLPKTRAAPRKAVLLLHGWNGHMDEVGDLYLDLANQLAERGIASLRFNFSGEGERVDYVVTSTLDSRIAETRQAFEFMRARFPGATYGVNGFSLGGLTAMAVIGEQPAWFDSLVLWSAAEEMRNSSDVGYTRAAKQAMREGTGVYTTWTTITLTREFLSSFVAVNVGQNLAKFEGSLLAIRGDQDFLPAVDPQWMKISPATEKRFILLGGADHIFNVLEDPRPVYGAQVIKETVDWFERTL